MPAVLEHTIGRWLHKLGAAVSPRLLREKLQTHPDYPSLLSVTDVLDELYIDNAALQMDTGRLHEAPLPLLAHNTSHAEFVIIENIEKQVKNNPAFEKNQNGAVLLAEKPLGWQHPENEKALKEEKQKQKALQATAGFVIVLAFLSFSREFSFTPAALLLTALTGLTVAILIVQREMGIATPIGEKLCGAGGGNGCDAVMHSGGSRLVKWMSWADVGIIYFTTYSLLLTIAMYTGGNITVLVLLSAAALPFTLFSLFYQWRVVKKWCRLCLLTVAVLWLQAALALAQVVMAKGDLWRAVVLNDFLLAAFLFTIISASWLLLIKPLLQNYKQLLTEKFALLRFKNNPAVFESLLTQQRRVDTTPFEHDMQLGNPAAPLQIMVACNPYCGPCAKAHEVLHDILNSNDIGLTIRFTVKTEDREDKKTQAVQYLLKLLHYSSPAQKRKALHDWFVWMNYEKFVTQYPLRGNAPDVVRQLSLHEQWTKEAEIKFTPTVFINGFQMPKQYDAGTLKQVLRRSEWLMKAEKKMMISYKKARDIIQSRG